MERGRVNTPFPPVPVRDGHGRGCVRGRSRPRAARAAPSLAMPRNATPAPLQSQVARAAGSPLSDVTEPSLPPRDASAKVSEPESTTPTLDTAADDPFAAPAVASEASAPSPPGSAAPAARAAPPRPRDLSVIATLVAFAIGCTLVIAGYVAINGGALTTSASPQTYEPAKMNIPRGLGRLDAGTLVAHGIGSDVLIVAVTTDFRARDLATVAWDVTGLPDNADVRLLFNSDYTPRRVHNRPLVVEDGRLRPIALDDDRDWLGRITGLALAVRAPDAVVRVRGVAVKPLSFRQLLTDRAGEWFRFEPWTGTSINSVTGGAATQTLPLPIPLALAALVALALVLGARRLFPTRLAYGIAPIAALVFMFAWLALDVRWTANLARQAAATIERYGGKSAEERAHAAEDGELVAFLDKARALLPDGPQRIVVLAEAHYFRGRAGWHLLPHRVWWEPARDVAPAPGMLRPGDYVLVWRRPGAQFDAARSSVRFDNGVEVSATALLVERGSALFAVR
jgi:hypothetical protein